MMLLFLFLILNFSAGDDCSLDSPLATGHYFAGTKSNFPFPSW